MFVTTQSSTDAQCSSTRHGRRVRQSIFRRRAGKEQAQEIETSDGVLMLQGHRLPRLHGRRVPQILKFKRRAGKEPAQEMKRVMECSCSRGIVTTQSSTDAHIDPQELPRTMPDRGIVCQDPRGSTVVSAERREGSGVALSIAGFIASSEFRKRAQVELRLYCLERIPNLKKYRLPRSMLAAESVLRRLRGDELSP